MRKVGVALAVTLVSGIQLSACSSSSGPQVTSLEPSKTLAQLTTEERTQFCRDQFQYMVSRVSTDDARKIDCSIAASAAGNGTVSGAQAQTACQQVYRACIAVPAQQPQSSCDTFAPKADGCMATVGEASACTQAHADALEQLAKKADDTCNNLGQPAMSAAEDPSQTPEACVRVETLCPMLFATPGPSSGMLHGWRSLWSW
jgi:hypothetical protein